jgi:hypothetical protein
VTTLMSEVSESRRQWRPDGTDCARKSPNYDRAFWETCPGDNASGPLQGDKDISRALQAGARGHILKDVPVEQMVECIRAVVNSVSSRC